MHICLKCMCESAAVLPYLSSSMLPTQDSLRDRVRVSSKLLNYGCKVFLLFSSLTSPPPLPILMTIKHDLQMVST